ncbi:MAG: radical SAM protein [bacterium]
MIKKILKPLVPVASRKFPKMLAKFYKYRAIYNEKYNQKKMPIEMQIEITTKCSARCIMCGHNDLKNIAFPIKDIDLRIIDRIKKVILDNYSDRIINICLFGVGEPLLCHNIFEIMKKLDMANVFFIIYTTGFNMTQDLANRLVKNERLKLVFSLNKKDKNSYRELMGVDKFNESINGIKVFLEEREKNNKAVGVQIKFFDDCEDFPLPEVDEFIRNYRDISIKYTPILYNAESKTLYPKNYYFYRYPCIELMSRFIYIDVDGGVYKCCQSLQNSSRGKANDLYLGNIMDLDYDTKKEYKMAMSEFKSQMHGEYGEYIKSCKKCLDHSVSYKIK